MINFDIDKISEAIAKTMGTDYPEPFFPEPPDELFKMLEYLPEEYADESEEKYIDALMLAAETSYINGLYQFAYMQYHMLFMSAVYYVLLKISFVHEEELKRALYYLLKDRHSEFWQPSNTKAGKLYFGSFATINESEVFHLLRIVGLDDSLLKDLKDLVKERNRYAHANGQLQLTSDELFLESLKKHNEIIDRVVKLIRNDLTAFYKATICDSEFYDPDIRAYLDPDEQIIQAFIKEFSLSQAELNWLRKIRLSEFDGIAGDEEIKTLHCALLHYYEELTNDDYQPFDDQYVLHKYRDNAAEFVERELEISAYECGKHGGEFPVYECPACGREQMAYDADTHRYHCFSCDANYTDEELSFCTNCGQLTRSSQTGLCPSCFAAIAEA